MDLDCVVCSMSVLPEFLANVKNAACVQHLAFTGFSIAGLLAGLRWIIEPLLPKSQQGRWKVEKVSLLFLPLSTPRFQSLQCHAV